MNEYSLIRQLFGNVKDLFTSDAQLIKIAGQKWGVTCDSFSLEEDLFTADNPHVLGQNLVTATLADLIATGCKPTFYEHTLTLPKTASETWVRELAAGISHALTQAGCQLIGGDMGQADKFAYTGIGLGPQLRNVSRLLPNEPQKLYVSGELGDVNESILKRLPTPLLEPRVLPACALAAIDTSSGFMDAVWQLHVLNPHVKFEINNPPVKDIRFLFGGAGEYELLFTSAVPVENAICIGMVTPGAEGVYLNGKEVRNAPPDPRSFSTLVAYMEAVEKQVYELFG